MHEETPVRVENLPVPHSTHDVSPEPGVTLYLPSPHEGHDVREASTYEPRGHAEHTVLPAEEMNIPGPQATHASDDEAPRATPNRPAAQSVHTVARVPVL